VVVVPAHRHQQLGVRQRERDARDETGGAAGLRALVGPRETAALAVAVAVEAEVEAAGLLAGAGVQP
jgi:hypothetical protein